MFFLFLRYFLKVSDFRSRFVKICGEKQAFYPYFWPKIA